MADDVYELNVIASVANQYVENVLHFDNVANANDPNPNVVANKMISAWRALIEPQWLALMANDYVLGGYRCRRVNNTGGPDATIIVPTGTVGSFGSVSVVSGAGAVLTGSYYQPDGTKPRWKVSRIFVPGLPQSAITENQFLAGYITQINTVMTLLDSAITNAGQSFLYSVWSRKYHKMYSLAALQLSLKVGTIRKRYSPVI